MVNYCGFMVTFAFKLVIFTEENVYHIQLEMQYQATGVVSMAVTQLTQLVCIV